MLKQIIVTTEMIPVKYHGLVKHIVFECNTCHKQFKKEESYYRKQRKKREHACCFCSPRCRTLYQMHQLKYPPAQPQSEPTIHATLQDTAHEDAPEGSVRNPPPTGASLLGWVSKFFQK